MGLRSAFVVLSCATAFSFGTLGCGSEPGRRCTFEDPVWSVQAVRTFSSTSSTDVLEITTCLDESCSAVRASDIRSGPEPFPDFAKLRLTKGSGDTYELTTTFRLQYRPTPVMHVSVRVRDGAKTPVDVSANLSWPRTADDCDYQPLPNLL